MKEVTIPPHKEAKISWETKVSNNVEIGFNAEAILTAKVITIDKEGKES